MTDDPRVAHLNAVATKVASDHRYETHLRVETLMFLARYDALHGIITPAQERTRQLGSGYAHIDNRWVKTPVPMPVLRLTAKQVMRYCASTPEDKWSMTEVAEIISNGISNR